MCTFAPSERASGNVVVQQPRHLAKAHGFWHPSHREVTQPDQYGVLGVQDASGSTRFQDHALGSRFPFGLIVGEPRRDVGSGGVCVGQPGCVFERHGGPHAQMGGCGMGSISEQSDAISIPSRQRGKVEEIGTKNGLRRRVFDAPSNGFTPLLEQVEHIVAM